MARFDPNRKPSPKLEARAIEEYGQDFPDGMEYRAFALLVASGTPLHEAYSVISATASEATSRSQASVLAAHPKVRQTIVQHGLPRRNLVESLVPDAVRTLEELMREGPATQARQAADSVLDRAGVPRSSEVRQTLAGELRLSGRALLEMAAEVTTPAPVGPAEGDDAIDAEEVDDIAPDLELPEHEPDADLEALTREPEPEPEPEPATPTTTWTRGGAGAEESRADE